MWSYYGSKSKIIDYYPPPKFGKIIEPFAGTARYALKYFDREVTINDKYDIIIRIWKWLQKCSKDDILKMAEPKLGHTINRKHFDCIEEAWLLGFFINAATATPRLSVSTWAQDNIGTQKRYVASQLFKIKHWLILHQSYDTLQNDEAVWFIDPPYQNGGHEYKHSSKGLSFNKLSDWCRERNGQIIVCENIKANWLPFKPLVDICGQFQKTTEAIWTNFPSSYMNEQLKLF